MPLIECRATNGGTRDSDSVTLCARRHAYYLDYKNVRPDYVKAIWGLANWTDVAARLAAAQK